MIHGSMSLKYEPSSELLHISAKLVVLTDYDQVDVFSGCDTNPSTCGTGGMTQEWASSASVSLVASIFETPPQTRVLKLLI